MYKYLNTGLRHLNIVKPHNNIFFSPNNEFARTKLLLVTSFVQRLIAVLFGVYLDDIMKLVFQLFSLHNFALFLCKLHY